MISHKPGSKACWEVVYDRARAVKYGNAIYVAGTTALNGDGDIVGGDDVYAQAVYAIKKIVRALHKAGACREDVVRTRVYITDIAIWEDVGRAHQEAFGDIRPANTMVIAQLIGEAYLVEIEAEAILSQD